MSAAQPVDSTLDPETRAAIAARADEIVAGFPPLTAEQLAEVRRIFAPTADVDGRAS